MASLAETLTACPLDPAAVDQAMLELCELPGDAARAAIVEARRAVRFNGNLVVWDYQQAILRLVKMLLGLSPAVRRVCVLNVAAGAPR